MTTLPRTVSRTLIGCAILCGVVVTEAAKIKIKAEPDPTFDFATLHTWAWDADAGDVIMARTDSDDPAPVKARVDPLIRKYVEAEMARKGLTLATAKPSDVELHYYVLGTITMGSQHMGQFLPAVPYWGLPPFAPATTAVNVATRGTLVLDAMLPGTVGNRHIIWRGVAHSTVEDTDSTGVREARIREAVQGLITRFPLKKKK